MKKLLLLTIFFAPGLLKAQLNKVIPPSPEASSVFKFLETPVSPYSGLTNTNVPLGEIKLKNITIPINLSYHGRGIRVEEIAPRVGLGWALNYGGMISRQVRGGVADAPSPGRSNGYDGLFTNSGARASLITNLKNGTAVDQAPDKYMLDMNGDGGNFLFDGNEGKFLFQKYADIDVVSIQGTAAEGGDIVAWIVTDKNGNKFYYGKNKAKDRVAIDQDITESSYSYAATPPGQPTLLSPSGIDPGIKNTWRLMEIETVNNEKVEFFYELETLQHYTRSGDRKDIFTGTNSPANLQVRCYYSLIESLQYQIKAISYSGGTITFGKGPTGRQDVYGYYPTAALFNDTPCTLDTVSIYDDTGTLLKQQLLQYQYTTAISTNNAHHMLTGLEPQSAKRLFLTSVQEKGKNGELVPPTGFEYSTVLLPNRFSNSQDAWGYYNGKANGEYLTFFDDLGIAMNRDIDTVLCEAGLLKKMNLSTGGSVSFTYEQNKGKAPYYMSQVATPASVSSHPVQEEFLKNSIYLVQENGAYLYKKNFTIGKFKTGLVTFNMSLPYCTGDDENASFCFYDVYLEGPYSSILPRQSTPRTLDLPPGNYTLKVIPQQTPFDPSDYHNTFFATISWSELDAQDSVQFAGGKRIKRIEYKNADATVLVKSYKYEYPDGTTSGQVLGLPCYFYLIPLGENRLNAVIQNPGYAPMYDILGGTPGTPLSNVQGNGVGYAYVEEYFGDLTNNHGKIAYTFTNIEDGGDYWKYPYTLPIDNEWLRGKPLSTSIYENNNGAYLLKKKTDNTYNYAGEPGVAGVFQEPLLHMGDVFEHTINRTNFYLPLIKIVNDTTLDFIVYYQIGGALDLGSTVETSYEGATSHVRQTVYNFDYDHHYEISGSESNKSDGSTYLTYTTYPNSYLPGTAFIDTLISNHILSSPIEQVSYKNIGGINTILSAGITKYKTNAKGQVDELLKFETNKPIASDDFKFSNRTVGVLPPDASTTTFLPDSRYCSRMMFDQYGGKGNLLQYTQRANATVNGPSTSYIWDYNERYPIAEIKNAVQTDVAYTSFEDSSTGNWTYNGTIISTCKVTGKNCLALGSNGSIAKTGLNIAKQYRVVMWFRSATGTPPGSGFNVILTLPGSGWGLYEKQIFGVSSFLFSAADGYVDDIRISPSDAQMTTYTYDPLVGMTSATDAKGLTTYYEYDSFQRLMNLKDQNGNILKHTDYHYQNQ